jgi:hypothetical protein
MQAAHGGQQRMGLAGAGLALDEQQARGRVRVFFACVVDDIGDRLVGGHADIRYVEQFLLGRAGKRCHRAENAEELGAFKGLKARIHEDVP